MFMMQREKINDKEVKKRRKRSSKGNTRKYGKSKKLLKDKPSEKERKRGLSSTRIWARKF